MVATFSPAQSLSNGMASDSRVMMRHISGTAENSAKATETKVWESAIAASTATVPVHNAIRKPAMENMMALAAKGRRRIRLTCLGARTWAAPKPKTRQTSHPQMPRKANPLSANPNTTSCASSESHSASLCSHATASRGSEERRRTMIEMARRALRARGRLLLRFLSALVCPPAATCSSS